MRGLVSRRGFLEALARWSPLLALGASARSDVASSDPPGLAELLRRAPVARFWTSTERKGASCADCHGAATIQGKTSHRHRASVVKCRLCAHECVIPEGGRGRCRARINLRGTLHSLVYGRPLAEHVDPIEKKPFYHFLPGREAYSLATAGCPLACRFCQNWEMSQARPEDLSAPWTPPEALVARASRRQVPVLAFTYNEPTVFAEYLLDIARLARRQGIRSVLVSCGFMNEAPLKELIEALDGIKIDLKGYSPDFYRKVTGGELAPVLRSIRQIARAGRHLEIVNLVVPSLNDAEPMLKELCAWIAGEVGLDVPVHFTRFHPDYQLLNLPPTPVASLERAVEAGRKAGLHHVYLGNVPGHPANHTYCPKCGQRCIERQGFFVTAIRMKKGACAACGTPLAGVWT